MIDALRRRPILVLVAVVAVIVVVKGVVDHQVEADRKAQGYELCEEAIRAELLDGYDPAIDVMFYEINTAGDFLYDALADDGDGDWACKVSWIDGEPDITTSAGTYRSSDRKHNSDWPGADEYIERPRD